jgi:hypothetical protein
MESVNFARADLTQSFSLTEGGPGAALMKRLHLVDPRGKGQGRTSLIL